MEERIEQLQASINELQKKYEEALEKLEQANTRIEELEGQQSAPSSEGSNPDEVAIEPDETPSPAPQQPATEEEVDASTPEAPEVSEPEPTPAPSYPEPTGVDKILVENYGYEWVNGKAWKPGTAPDVETVSDIAIEVLKDDPAVVNDQNNIDPSSSASNLNEQTFENSGQLVEEVRLSGNWYVDSLLNTQALGKPVKWVSDQYLSLEDSNNSSTIISYSFPDLENTPAKWNYTDDRGTIVSKPFSEEQSNDIRDALSDISKLINIDFIEVSETEDKVGTLRFALNTITDEDGVHRPGIVATADPPGLEARSGDVWFNINYSEADFSKGLVENSLTGVGELTVLYHEIFHALGLEHPNDNSSILFENNKNFREYTVMAGEVYSDGSLNYFDNGKVYTVVSTPMVYDIAPLQYLYGPNLHYNDDDTTYAFDPTKPIFETIWDAGGNDTLDLSQFSKDNFISLDEGSYSTIISNDWQMENNLGIAFGTEIENVIGGSGDDIIRGNSGNNLIKGLGGSDVLTGADGLDTFTFGSNFGNDIITDFTVGEDKLVYNGVPTSSSSIDGFQIFTFDDGSTILLQGVETIDDLNTFDSIGNAVDQHSEQNIDTLLVSVANFSPPSGVSKLLVENYGYSWIEGKHYISGNAPELELEGDAIHTVTVSKVGNQNVFFIDGNSNPDFVIEAGKTYRFDQSDESNANHTLNFLSEAGADLSSFVETSGTAGTEGAYVDLRFDAGDIANIDGPELSYYCELHGAAMGNDIEVQNIIA